MKNDNKWKLFLRSFKSHLTRNIIIFLALALWFLYSDFWGSLITTVLVNPFASKLHGIYWDIIFLLIVLLLLFYYIFLVWRVEKFVNKKRFYFSLVITILVSSCLFFPSYTQFWKFHYLFGGFCPYAYIFLLPLLSELIHSICLSLKCKSVETIYKGLEFEKPINANSGVDSYRRGGYANSVSNLLVETFDNEFAYAVGITGEWGSGKTSFVNQIKNALTTKKLEIEVIDFKPWFCKTSSSIIDDFFTIYEQCISYYSPGTCRLLRKYAYSLSCLKETNIGAWINFAVYCLNNKDIQTQYENISKELSQAKVKTIVFIDDLDRLDKDEIIEVFRLIRNTANFPYLQFVVAYDKEYITKMIGDLCAGKAEKYIEKIFNSEIALPKINNDEISKTTLKSIKDVLTKYDFTLNGRLDDRLDELINIELTSPSQISYLFISQILHTVRDVIRFKNSFEVALKSLIDYFKKNNEDNFSIDDLFYLELLKFRYPQIYNKLRDNAAECLITEIGSRYYVPLESPMFTYPRLQKKEVYSDSLLEGEIIITDKIKNKSCLPIMLESDEYNNEQGLISVLLTRVYPPRKMINTINRACQINSFDLYFMYRTPEESDKISSLLDLINDTNKLTNLQPDEIEERLDKSLSKILYMVSNSTEESRLYLKVYMFLDSLLVKYIDTKIGQIIRTCMIQYFNSSPYVSSEQSKELVKFRFVYLDLFDDSYNVIFFKLLLCNNYSIKDEPNFVTTDNYKIVAAEKILKNSISKEEFESYIINPLLHLEISIALYQIIKDETIVEPNLVIPKSCLKNYQIDLLDDYLKSSDINMKKALHLTYYCVERIEEGTLKIIVNPKAIKLIHTYILNNPEKYIANFVGSSSKNNNPKLGGYLFPEPFWNQIFGDKDKLEEFLFNPKYNRFSNVDKARNLWMLYKSNGFNNVEFSDSHYYLDFLNNDGKEVMAAFNVLIGLDKELDDLKAKFHNYKIDKIELTSQLDDLNKRQKEVTLYIKLNGDVARKIKELN